MNARCFLTVLFLAGCTRGLAHEFPGHGEHEHGNPTTIGTELYLGKRDYWHAGAGVSTPLGKKLTLELGVHVVHEETGAREVPSFEAELIREFNGGWELEAFGFGYPTVERKQAWGFGLRGTKRYAFQNGLTVSPFFGPAYAQVRALDEAADEMVTVHHTLLLGGVTVEAGPVSVTLVGSHSLYNRNPAGLETPVDFESMSHFAAYENNDGFPQSTFAVETAYAAAEWLTLHARYAVMQFEEETRHAITVSPALKIGEHAELSVGVQLLRGGAEENDLVFLGMSFSF